MAPLIRECQERGQSFVLIHTGQHYSDSLDSVFFEQLELPKPDYHLGVGSASHGEQTGQMLIAIEEVLLDEEPDVVFVQGDTNSVLAGAIATSKLDCELAHVEAGLRSFDRGMPEETNRVLADHVSDYLFAPTEQSREYLLDEGRPEENISVTGNTIVDALYRNRELAREKSTVISDLGLEGEEFFLMTSHRAENVDDEKRFRGLLEGVAAAAAEHNVEVVYPIHPRAESRIDEFGLEIPDCITLIEPQDYLDFLQLEAEASLILTDSGGVQEEACVLRIPCVTLRENTERSETVDVGANTLAGTDPDSIVSESSSMLQEDHHWENPFGDGQSAERIIDEATAKGETRDQISQHD
ncbi:non-hydrolyzing UDP-N-acetylglucosamine 2-epimerase [Natronomonas salina]|uniref:non-hydrolyzing UDP-N-acetylglucosamine 2-epimerase n=1 Tax=Natronomonas salina TaxID=1710540 RepID=UPI001FEB520E|nr:UDP-N-acetylglucosamine 2-epimerase (non-hydrolyzing) [Natronomonas salina]